MARRAVHPLLKRTLWQALPTLAGILLLNFVLLRCLPGDAVDVLASESGGASAETLAQWRSHFGLDLSLPQQLWAYLSHLLQFDLGLSPRYNVPVLQLILERLPNTLLLMVGALGLAVALGIAAGTAMATWAGRWPDRLLSLAVLLLYSTPGFWIGLMAVVLFSVKLGWLPSDGVATLGVELHGVAWLADRAAHALLPITALATFYIALYARLTRAAMLEVQRQDYVRTARAKGLSPPRVAVRHVLRNALLPVTTLAGLHFAALLGGAAVTETLFGWPGLGRLTLDAVMARDYNLLLGILLLSSVLVVVANVAVDLLQAWLDPRIRDT
ncbi:ABC transporter permease [Pseudomonas sp. KNUC1026]|uniref:ABC transporter permease n=1 Tax=Pseudomonas sp. KNUC1026 TaxID=2893890 RepID=UPI001F27C948|nr:ABC transporter permease [Pseudomonas sp. KNUC1026]UFH51075.1 ABC transporter permease [Pseudomonas sp. KNUC1026]